MAAVAIQQSSDDAYKARQTKAMPKNSLFGTNLEIYDEVDQDQPAYQQRDATKKIHKDKKDLPDHLKAQLPDSEIVIQKRKNFERQKDIVRQRRDELRSVESKALSFDPDPRTRTSGSVSSSHHDIDRTHQWYTKKDLDHAEDINVGGLKGSRNFNRDKQGRRPPIQYHSGDVFKSDTRSRQAEGINRSCNCNDWPLPKTVIANNKEVQTATPKDSFPHSAIEIPPNIRHKVGSKICDELMSDPRKVQEAMAEQRRGKDPRLCELDTSKYVLTEYNKLGNICRRNICPGHSTVYKKGTTHTVHNALVFEQRCHVPDEYRYQSDHLSKWAEQNILRERMKKAMDPVEKKKN